MSPELDGVATKTKNGLDRIVWSAKTLSALAALGCAIPAAKPLSLEDSYMRRAGWGWLINSGICAVALAVLVLRRRWSAGQAGAVSLLLIATTLVAQVHSDWTSALSQARFAPFEGFKVVALMVAMLVPFRPALAYALVGACAVLPLAIYGVMPAPMRAHLPIEAPWTTVIYPLIATGILICRVRARRLEREMLHAIAQREELERFAKVSLAYRDLANAPLQTIKLVRAELRKEHPESKELLDRLRGASPASARWARCFRRTSTRSSGPRRRRRSTPRRSSPSTSARPQADRGS